MKTLWYSLVLSLMILVGCDDSSDSTTRRLELVGKITARNSDITLPQPNDIYEYRLNNGYIVVVTDKTQVRRQRESCSGYDNVNPRDLEKTDIVTIFYHSKDINYGDGEPVVRPVLIEADRAECIYITPASISTNNTCDVGCPGDWMK